MLVKQGPKRLCVGVGYSGELYAHADSTWRNFWEIEAGCSPPHWGEREETPNPSQLSVNGKRTLDPAPDILLVTANLKYIVLSEKGRK